MAEGTDGSSMDDENEVNDEMDEEDEREYGCAAAGFSGSEVALRAAGKEKEAYELQDFKCPVCLDVFTDPVEINCGSNHVMCRTCMQGVLTQMKLFCPKCRGAFDPDCVKVSRDTHFRMMTSKPPCPHCLEKMSVYALRDHVPKCPKYNRTSPRFQPVANSSQSTPRNVPNRYTFVCPFCAQANLDHGGLVEHCNKNHSTQDQHVVCPICAAMPWGNPSQVSTDFLRHINLRHKFEYDTFVDYSADEDVQLQAALQASLAPE